MSDPNVIVSYSFSFQYYSDSLNPI